MKLILIFLAAMLCSVNLEILDSEVLKSKLLFYMPSIHTEKLNMESIGLNLILYGYVINCVKGGNWIDVMNSLTVEKKDNNILMTISKFYEFYILPYGDYDNTLWHMFTTYVGDYDAIYPKKGFYLLSQYRGCDKEVMQCVRYLPERPPNLHFSEVQCKRALLFINEFKYRAETFALPVDYYALNIYVLTKLKLSRKSLGNENQDEKLFEMKFFLNYFLKKDKADYERKFINFLNFRKVKEELIQKDLNDCVDSYKKEYIEEELKFHKMISNMMVQGWMIDNNITPTDGKFEITDSQGKKYVYDVPPITDF